VSELEDQRDFLLRSLEDLEREHEAGDVDALDYATLKDDYTARAATVLRAIEEGAAPRRQPAARRLSGRPLVALVGVLVFAGLAGTLVAQTAGRRDAGDPLTGGIRQSTTEMLNEAGRLGAETDYEGGIALYDDVLDNDPNNAEALTYRGWYLIRSGATADGLTQLLEAATVHPTYPDVHAFLAVVFARTGLRDEAINELELLDALDPPAFVRDLVANLRAELADSSSSSTTTTTTPG